MATKQDLISDLSCDLAVGCSLMLAWNPKSESEARIIFVYLMRAEILT
jgi:hypothetical protein